MPVSETLFNKAAGSQVCNFIKKKLQHGNSLVVFVRAPILKKIC